MVYCGRQRKRLVFARVEVLVGGGHMDKPTVFFSHSRKDKDALVRLKALFTEKTGSSIEVFLSSDGQSIPLGRNWVHAVELGLNRAKLMFVFVTPSSLRSDWLYFESGYAYKQGLRVVPVGFKGVDLGKVPPPLGLLQGFNITSEASLDNIIVVANEEFECSHTARFTPDEYREIVALGEDPTGSMIGAYGLGVDEIRLHLDTRLDVIPEGPPAWLGVVEQVLHERRVAYQKEKEAIHFDGVTLRTRSDVMPAPLDFWIDPKICGTSLPTIEAIVGRMRQGGVDGIRLEYRLGPGARAETQEHRISSRLYGSEAHLDESQGFTFGEVSFTVKMLEYHDLPAKVVVHISVHGKTIPLTRIRELLELLSVRRVLWSNREDE
jgi:hypothetical protein